jgi:Lar family restriction alleviation protein
VTLSQRCPFCGGVADVTARDYGLVAAVCWGCGAEGPASESEIDAAAAWDRRVNSATESQMTVSEQPRAGSETKRRGNNQGHD